MDTLGYVGRGYSTFTFVSLTLLGILFVIIGILMLVSASKGVEPSTDPTKPPMSVEMKVGVGLVLIVLGVIFPYSGWVNRKLVRGNNDYAKVSGAFAIFNMFTGGRK